MFNSSRRSAISAVSIALLGLGIFGASDAMAVNFQTLENTVDTNESAGAGGHTVISGLEGISFKEQDIRETFLSSENQINAAQVELQPFEPVEVSEPQSNFGILVFAAVAFGAALRCKPAKSARA